MSKILKRPMFRKGGSANNGIMDGLVDRKVEQLAGQMGIEQEFALEQIKAKDDPNKALRNVYLTQAIENGYDAPEAQRIADYQITTKTELQNKVGRELVGGIIEFDLNDEKQTKKQLPKLKKKIGHYFYDPYDGKIKRLVEKNGVLGFDEFNSVADITFGLDEGTSTISTSPYADEQAAIEQEKQEGILTDEDILAQRFP